MKNPFARRPAEQPLFDQIVEAKDPRVRRLAVAIIAFRVLMEAYGHDPGSHQTYRELLQSLDDLCEGVTAHHRQLCACGGMGAAETVLSMQGDERLFE
jgi:hypothetical protein